MTPNEELLIEAFMRHCFWQSSVTVVCKCLPQRIRPVLQEGIADPVLYPLYG